MSIYEEFPVSAPILIWPECNCLDKILIRRFLSPLLVFKSALVHGSNLTFVLARRDFVAQI